MYGPCAATNFSNDPPTTNHPSPPLSTLSSSAICCMPTSTPSDVAQEPDAQLGLVYWPHRPQHRPLRSNTISQSQPRTSGWRRAASPEGTLLGSACSLASTPSRTIQATSGNGHDGRQRVNLLALRPDAFSGRRCPRRLILRSAVAPVGVHHAAGESVSRGFYDESAGDRANAAAPTGGADSDLGSSASSVLSWRSGRGSNPVAGRLRRSRPRHDVAVSAPRSGQPIAPRGTLRSCDHPRRAPSAARPRSFGCPLSRAPTAQGTSSRSPSGRASASRLRATCAATVASLKSGSTKQATSSNFGSGSASTGSDQPRVGDCRLGRRCRSVTPTSDS